MKKRIKSLTIPTLAFACCLITSCFKHSPDDIETVFKPTDVTAYYNEVTIDWDSNTFTHDGFTISIPEKWGAGFYGKRSLFKKYNPHDIKFCYSLQKKITYGGEEVYVASFDELVKVEPKQETKIFDISTVGLDIDSKILVKDELINDCYFKYDTNNDFDNFCYFKIAKNDVNQLKEGYFNQISVKLRYLIHIDNSLSFAISEGKDGLNEIGYYSDVSISHNPDLISA